MREPSDTSCALVLSTLILDFLTLCCYGRVFPEQSIFQGELAIFEYEVATIFLLTFPLPITLVLPAAYGALHAGQGCV